MPEGNGFTLLEMLIVLVIVATLAMVAVPGYLQPMQRVEATQAGACLLELASRLERYRLSEGDYEGFAIDAADVACEARLADRYRFEAGVPGEMGWAVTTTDPVAWQLRVRADGFEAGMGSDRDCRALVVRDDGQRGVMIDTSGGVVTDAGWLRRCWR